MDTENKNVETSEFVEIMREELKEEEEKPKEISEDTVSKTFTGEKAPIVDMDEFIADYYARTVTRLLTDKILSKEKGKEFRDVIGLAQNFLLEGPPGVGKTTALFLFHNYILPYLVAFEYIRRKYEIDEKRIVDIVFKSPDAIRINIQNKSIVTKGETKRITQQGSSPIGIVNPYLDDYINFMLSSSDYKPLTTFGALLKASYLETGSKGRIDPRIIEVIDNEKIKNMIKSLKVEKISDFSEFTRFVVSMNFKLPTKIVTRTESGLEETEKEEEVKIEYMWTHLSLSAMSESLIENIKVGRSKRGEQNVVSSVHSVLKDSLEYSDIIVVDEYNRAPKETLEAFLGATSTMSNKVFVFIGNLGDSEGESFVEMHSTREGARIVNAFWERVKPFAIVPGKIYRPPIIYIFSNMLLKRAKENKEVTDLEKAREIATNKVETIYDILVEGHNYSSRMVARLFQLLVSGVDIDDILLPNEVKELLKMLVDPTKEVLKIDEDFKKVSQELSKKRKDYKNLTFKDIVDKERSLVTMVDSILSEAPLMNITGVTMDYYIDYVLRPILNFFFSNDKDTNEPLVLGAFGAPGTAKTTLITEFLNKRYPYELQELMKAKSSKKQPINKQTVHVSTIKKQNTDVMKEIEGIHNSYDVIMKQIISKIKNLKGYLEKIKEKVEQALNLDKKALEENNLIEELNKFIKVVDNIIQFIESLYGFQQIIHTGEETEKKIEEIEKSIQETMKEINKQETGNQEKVTVRTISDLIAEINNFISEKFYHPIIQQIKQFRPTENREKYIKEISQISEEIEKISEQINAIRKDAKKLYLNVKKIVYSHATAIIHMVRIGNIGYNWSILTFSESAIKYLKTMVVPKVLFPELQENTENIANDVKTKYEFTSDVISFLSDLINKSDIIVFDEATRLPAKEYYDVLLKVLSDRTNKVFLMIGNVGADERINLRDLSKAFKDRLIFYKIVHNPEHSPEELNKLLGTINGIIQKFILFLIASKTIEAVFGVSKQEQNIKNLFKDFETVKQEINNILIRESKIIESKLNKLGSRATNEQAIANLKKELYYHVKVGLKNIILYFVSVNINKVPVNTNKEQEKLSILKEEVETKIKSIAEKISMKIPLLIEEILKNASRKREKVKTKKGVQEVKIYNPRTVNKKLSEGVGALQAYNLSDFLINQLDTVLEKWEAIKKKKILEKQEIKDENKIELEVLKEIPKIFTDPKNGLYVMIEAMVSGLTKAVFEEFRKGVIREIQEEILTVLSNNKTILTKFLGTIMQLLSYSTLKKLTEKLINSKSAEELNSGVEEIVGEIVNEVIKITKKE